MNDVRSGLVKKDHYILQRMVLITESSSKISKARLYVGIQLRFLSVGNSRHLNVVIAALDQLEVRIRQIKKVIIVRETASVIRLRIAFIVYPAILVTAHVGLRA